MITLNGNVMCAIDVETTGLEPGYHEITQVCFLPLTRNLEIRKDVVPFDLRLHIEYEERIDWDALHVTKTNFMQHQQSAINKHDAADLFERWVEKLDLPERKRISPLAHNWPFDRSFIMDWLGPKTFGIYVDGRFRDTMSTAIAINDIYDFVNEPTPFAKVNLGYLASSLKMKHVGAHNALADCAMTVKVYKTLMNRYYLEGSK